MGMTNALSAADAALEKALNKEIERQLVVIIVTVQAIPKMIIGDGTEMNQIIPGDRRPKNVAIRRLDTVVTVTILVLILDLLILPHRRQ
ncbi:hypothetical protein EVAR_69337_1 [Eumeta japonica]|uniref:Uncharacterized protein n=1 Tax=Eumeta variegata TaxID=151549 RepID=A0A4C1SWF3_EUMVA|nr:hypothetical protein EVAR_69337_1 [Eumeta japonica]